MRVRAAVLAWAILLGCGAARDSGSGAAVVTSQASTPPPAGPSVSSTPSPAGATQSNSSAPSETPSTPADTAGTAPSPPAPQDRTPAPPPSPVTPHAWAGTQVFTTPWTEIDGVATLPGGRLLVHGSQFLTNNGIGSRHGTLAWTDASGKVERVLEVQQVRSVGAAGVDDGRELAGDRGAERHRPRYGRERIRRRLLPFGYVRLPDRRFLAKVDRAGVVQ
jgi:hypothetical protein